MIATFGRATIRRFGGNISGMKQLAARDFEQILKVCFVLSLTGDCRYSANPQCAIPCFENLLPEPANTMVLNLLFELAQWHTFAKLQLHSESTITAFRAATSTLGQAVHAFQRHVCPKYATQELPRETQSRQRRKAAAAQKSGQPQHGAASLAPQFKAFTVPDTPKYHRLGDYARGIVETGTHDLKSTQAVSSLHSCSYGCSY